MSEDKKHTPLPKLYIGAQNDILYIIDSKPRPVNGNDFINPEQDVNLIAKIYKIEYAQDIVYACNSHYNNEAKISWLVNTLQKYHDHLNNTERMDLATIAKVEAK